MRNLYPKHGLAQESYQLLAWRDREGQWGGGGLVFVLDEYAPRFFCFLQESLTQLGHDRYHTNEIVTGRQLPELLEYKYIQEPESIYRSWRGAGTEAASLLQRKMRSMSAWVKPLLQTED